MRAISGILGKYSLPIRKQKAPNRIVESTFDDQNTTIIPE